jgi:hypothetical protein
MIDSGASSFDLFIAQTGLEIDCQPLGVVEVLLRRYRGFTNGSDTQFKVYIKAHQEPNALGLGNLPLSFSGGKVVINAVGYQGEIDIENSRALIDLPTQRMEEDVDYFLRVVSALLIFQNGGLMLHAAGILSGDRVYVFFGHSGSGKTTIARHSREDDLLNDDLLVLRPEGNEWRIYATPFWNPTQARPANRSGKLHGLFRLVQDSRVYLEEVSPAVALAELVSNVPVIPADPSRSNELLARCQSILGTAGVHLLHFLPDGSFWSVVKSNKLMPMGRSG